MIYPYFQAYYTSLAHVSLYGPTMFAPIIRHNARLANAFSDGRQYFVLLVRKNNAIRSFPQKNRCCVIG